eukprot:10449018-Alexandrium_andersonii.AAC.1
MGDLGGHTWRRLRGIGHGISAGPVQEGHTGTKIDEGQRETWAQEGWREGNEGTRQDCDLDRR